MDFKSHALVFLWCGIPSSVKLSHICIYWTIKGWVTNLLFTISLNSSCRLPQPFYRWGVCVLYCVVRQDYESNYGRPSETFIYHYSTAGCRWDRITIPEVRRRIVPVCASALIILWEIILSPRVFPAYNKDNKFWHNSCIVFDLIMLPSQNSLLGAYFHQSHHSIFVAIQYVFPVIIVLPLDSHRWDLSIGTTFIPIL